MLDSATYEKYGPKYTQNWGYRGGEVLNERVNYYHKPQIALNWYYDISDELFLATSAYVSFGTGGGSGPLGIGDYVTTPGGDGYYLKYEPPQTASGYYDWDLLATLNNTDMINVDDGDTTMYAAGESKHIIRNSVNNHFWYGILSNLTWDITDNFKFTGGIDGRFYVGEHYREVRDLVGGDYWTDRTFGQTQVGDKIAYWNDGVVSYGGIFAQMEYISGKFAAFLGGTVSNTWTKRIDYMSYQTGVVTEDYAKDNANTSETLSNMGWNIKAGANFNITENHNIFLNGGAYSRVPFFRFHFLNYRNDVNPDLENEKIYAVELGYGFTNRKIRLNFNGYYTIWDDINELDAYESVWPDSGDEVYVNAFTSGLQQVHYGVELDAQYNVNRWINVGALVALGKWTYAKDATVVEYDDQNHQKVNEYTIYIEDLKIPNQPQTQVGLNADFKIARSIVLGGQWLYYDQLYADFFPYDRSAPTPEEADRSQSYQIPSYSVFNARATWSFKFAGLDSQVQLNCYNLFDTEAVVEAEDKPATDANGNTYHTFKKGFWGWGRNFNFAIKVNF